MNPISTNLAVRRALNAFACVGLALVCIGCTTIGPKPWQKDLMSRREMQVGAYALQAAAEDHIYFSKEASSGGRGFAGGGCGCN